MRVILFLFTLSFLANVRAQVDSKFCIKVVDQSSGLPLPRATIMTDNEIVCFTNNDGVAVVQQLSPISISISFIGYTTQLKFIKKIKSDTLLVLLVPKKEVLPEVSVMPEKSPFLVFYRPDAELLDFELWGNYALLGIHYFNYRNCSLVIIDSAKNILSEYPLPSDFEFFYKSPIQKYYAVCSSEICEIQFKKGVLFLKRINPVFFMIEWCIIKHTMKNIFI